MMILNILIIDIIIQLIGLRWSIINKSEKYYDLAGTSAFVLCTLSTIWFGHAYCSTRSLVAALMIIVWASRLGYFLYSRITRFTDNPGVDKRFEGVRDKPKILSFYWFMQTLWVFLVIVPLLLLNKTQYQSYQQFGQQQQQQITLDNINDHFNNHNLFNLVDIGLMVLWLFGFSIECIADLQKRKFHLNPNNHGKWIASGLWNYSRHPNYVGEIIVHWSIYAFCVRGYPSIDGSLTWSLVALVAPLFVTFLMTKISTPMLEKLADNRWKGNTHYDRYKQTTPKLFPFPTIN
ncbi:putative transmembrane protein [Cavenderia fasciculata]|uniref:Transmembrane protein n=1 Tax=Cavenderia fasciculata TaxID=261658 RepID=F4Q5D8_CACFS|nr:putative transmembrane protein [Cavenderia fasciculata]EGG17197.1 putative transmembrane protein [Cavenderia fasciculata]|eukprot:XP_004355681.1 putative transmembrane protein [Cavenderia fasciculata]